MNKFSISIARLRWNEALWLVKRSWLDRAIRKLRIFATKTFVLWSKRKDFRQPIERRKTRRLESRALNYHELEFFCLQSNNGLFGKKPWIEFCLISFNSNHTFAQTMLFPTFKGYKNNSCSIITIGIRTKIVIECWPFGNKSWPYQS